MMYAHRSTRCATTSAASLCADGRIGGVVSKTSPPKPGHRTPLAGEDPSEFRGCSRKKRYTTRLEARKAADAVSKRKDAPRLYVYECPYCSGWHLTHRRKGN